MLIHWVLQDMQYTSCYLDDILIGRAGDTKEELIHNHYNDVESVPKTLKEYKLVAEISKTDSLPRRYGSVDTWYTGADKLRQGQNDGH